MKRKHNSIDQGSYPPSLFRNNYHSQKQSTFKPSQAKSSSQAVISSRYPSKISAKQSSSMLSNQEKSYRKLSNSEIKTVRAMLQKERSRKQEENSRELWDEKQEQKHKSQLVLPQIQEPVRRISRLQKELDTYATQIWQELQGKPRTNPKKNRNQLRQLFETEEKKPLKVARTERSLEPFQISPEPQIPSSRGSLNRSQFNFVKKQRKQSPLNSRNPNPSQTFYGFSFDHQLDPKPTPGFLYSWGSCEAGELGNDHLKDSNKRPIKVSLFEGLGQQISQVSCGASHVLALTPIGQIYSWGENALGQLGQADLENRSSPCLINTLPTSFKIACGAGHSLSLSTNGHVYTWGASNDYQTGQNQRDNILLPTKIYAISERVRVISGGFKHSLLLSDKGEVFSFGSNKYGQCGEMTNKHITKPEKNDYLQGKKIIDVKCGGYHSIIISVHSEVYTFGLNKNGQLGIGSRDNAYIPQKVKCLPVKTNFKRIVAGDECSAVLSQQGDVYAWGWNGNHQFGRYLTEVPMPQLFELKGDKKARKKSAPNQQDLLLPKKMMLPIPNGSLSPKAGQFLKIQKLACSSTTLFVSDRDQLVQTSKQPLTFKSRNIHDVAIGRNCRFGIVGDKDVLFENSFTPIMASPLPVISEKIPHKSYEESYHKRNKSKQIHDRTTNQSLNAESESFKPFLNTPIALLHKELTANAPKEKPRSYARKPPQLPRTIKRADRLPSPDSDLVQQDTFQTVVKQEKRGGGSLKPISSSQQDIFDKFMRNKELKENMKSGPSSARNSWKEQEKKETELPRLKQVLRQKGDQLRFMQKNQFKSTFKHRDLSPIAVESSQLEIETPDRLGDQSADRLFDSITKNFTKQFQDARFHNTSTTPSTSSGRRGEQENEIEATKLMATHALDQMLGYRPYGGVRDWSPKRPTFGRVEAQAVRRGSQMRGSGREQSVTKKRVGKGSTSRSKKGKRTGGGFVPSF